MSEKAESLEQIAEYFKRSIAKIGSELEYDADWEPVIFLIADGQKTIVAVKELFTDEESKEFAFATAIPMAVHVTKAYIAGFIGTAWFVHEPDEETQEAIRSGERKVHQQADKREAVVMTIVTREEAQMHTAEIVRRPGQHPQLKPWTVSTALDDDTKLSGHMIDALRRGMEE